MAVDDVTTLAEWRIGGRLDPSAHRPDDWLYADLTVTAELVGPDVIDPTNSADIVSREWSVVIGGAPDTDGDGVDEPDGTATEAGRVWWTDNLKPTFSTGDAGLAFAPQSTSWLIKVQIKDKNGRLVSLTERSLTIDGARDYEAEGETFTRPDVFERDGETLSQIIDVRHLVPPVESVPPTDLFADAVDAAVADGHAVAVDPHGDRAYADGVAATVAADAATYADGVGTAAVTAAAAAADAAILVAAGDATAFTANEWLALDNATVGHGDTLTIPGPVTLDVRGRRMAGTGWATPDGNGDSNAPRVIVDETWAIVQPYQIIERLLFDGQDDVETILMNADGQVGNECRLVDLGFTGWLRHALLLEDSDATELRGVKAAQRIAADPLDPAGLNIGGEIAAMRIRKATKLFGGNLGKTWGYGLLVDAIGDDLCHVQLTDPRVNFCYRGWVVARGPSSVVSLSGGYFEGASRNDNPNTTEPAYGFAAEDGATISLSDSMTASQQHCDGEYRVSTGGQIRIGSGVVAFGSKTAVAINQPVLFSSDGTGAIQITAPLSLPGDLASNQTPALSGAWTKLLDVDTTPLEGFIIDAQCGEVVAALDGSTHDALAAFGGTKSYASGADAQTSGASIRLTGNGGTANRLEFDLSGMVADAAGHLVLVSAVAKTSVGTTDEIRSHLQLVGTGVELADATPQQSSASGWVYHQALCHVVDPSAPLKLSIYLNNSGAAASDDSLYLDRLTVRTIPNRRRS